MYNIFLGDNFSGFNPAFLYIIIGISLISGILIITSKNPIISVLYLILLFGSMSCYLVLIGLKFINISYLLIYVGALLSALTLGVFFYPSSPKNLLLQKNLGNIATKKSFNGSGYRIDLRPTLPKRNFSTSSIKKADPFTAATAVAAVAPIPPVFFTLNNITLMTVFILSVATMHGIGIQINVDNIFTSGLATSYEETARVSLASNLALELEQTTQQLQAALPSILETSTTEFLQQMRESLRYIQLIIDGSVLNDPFNGAFDNMFRWGIILERSHDEYISDILSYIILDIAWPAFRNAGNAISDILEEVTNHLDDGAHGPIRWFEY